MKENESPRNIMRGSFKETVNSAAMNTGLHVSLSVLVSSVCMPSSGIAGSYGSSISSFLRPTMFLKSEHNMKLKDACSLEEKL